LGRAREGGFCSGVARKFRELTSPMFARAHHLRTQKRNENIMMLHRHEQEKGIVKKLSGAVRSTPKERKAKQSKKRQKDLQQEMNRGARRSTGFFE